MGYVDDSKKILRGLLGDNADDIDKDEGACERKLTAKPRIKPSEKLFSVHFLVLFKKFEKLCRSN